MGLLDLLCAPDKLIRHSVGKKGDPLLFNRPTCTSKKMFFRIASRDKSSPERAALPAPTHGRFLLLLLA